MPRRAAERPAAYTRTRHLLAFLEQVERAVPTRVDEDYVKERLGLRGGDVRACLQSLRVLGLVDSWGRATERLRRLRSRERRPALLREALHAAYPELAGRWEAAGGLTRAEVEDHFKLEYGLGVTSAAPAAKLFVDLWEMGEGDVAAPAPREAAKKGGEAGSATQDWEVAEPSPSEVFGGAKAATVHGEAGGSEERLGSLIELAHKMVDQDWDAERIRLMVELLGPVIH